MSSSQSAHVALHDAEIIGLVGLAHGTSHFFHLMLPPLFPWLMRDFSLTFTQAGFLMTVFFVISGVGQALAGFAVDRLGARPILFFGVGTLGLSGVALALSSNYSMLVLTAALAGLGNSIFHPADFTLLNQRVSPPRLGHAFSVHGITGNLGWAIAPILMTGTAALTDWHWAGVAAATLAFAVLAILWWRRTALNNVLVADERSSVESNSHLPTSKFGFLAAPAVWMCFAFFFFTTVAFGILQTYGPALMREMYGLNLALATSGLTAFLLGGAAGMLVGGMLASHRQDNDKVVAISLGLSVVFAMLLASAWVPGWMVIPLLTCMGFCTGIAGPHRDLLVRRVAAHGFGQASFGRIYGFVYSGLDVGLAFSPLVFGPMMDTGWFIAVFLSVALLQGLAIFTALGVGKLNQPLAS